ncbi:MAG: phosphatidate cytidylyltransferase [Desulfobulbus sp.]|nr:phosphatidate cytidylyltransferase [Desulfobulbaceae bacterium]
MSRVLPGLAMAVAWLLLLALAPAWLFGLVLVSGASMALSEYFRMGLPTLQGGVRLLVVLCCLAPVLTALSGRAELVLFGLFLSLAAWIALGLIRYTRWENVLHFLSTAGFGGLYIGLCSAYLMLLRLLPHGSFWLILLTAIIAGSDTGAYYSGRRFGRRKIFPNISPKKTLEGVLGGIFCGVAFAIVVQLFMDGPISQALLVPVAVFLVLVGIAGDLTESMIKRASGVKDSGTILAGHGGLLDRIDSLLLSAPVLYYLLYFLGIS